MLGDRESGVSKKALTVGLILFAYALPSASVLALSFSMAAATDSSTYYAGQSGKLINVRITNQGTWDIVDKRLPYEIKIREVVVSFEWGKKTVVISPELIVALGETKSLPNISFEVPIHQATGVYPYMLGITYEEKLRTTWFEVGTKYDASIRYLMVKSWGEYQTEQARETTNANALVAINSVKGAINSASFNISVAQNALDEARNEGADVTRAKSELVLADLNIQNARSKLNKAEVDFSYGTKEGYESAKEYAGHAVAEVQLAALHVDAAFNLVVQAKEAAVTAKNSAKAAIDKAKEAIDSTNSLISVAQTAISPTEALRTDASSARTFFEASKAKLKLALEKYNEGISQFNNKNYTEAKRYAGQAEIYAMDAQEDARKAESIAVEAKKIRTPLYLKVIVTTMLLIFVGLVIIYFKRRRN